MDAAGHVELAVSREYLAAYLAVTRPSLSRELSAMQKEMDTLNLLYERQREQYQVARQNVQIINKRCHELKLQIAALRQMSGAPADPELKAHIDEAEKAAQLYDASRNTGNEVLDVVLTEKSLLCESRRIQLNAVTDGSCLSFFEASDLYALFCQYAGPRH